jgi:Holliday junction resolvase RusA-like endonuclease
MPADYSKWKKDFGRLWGNCSPLTERVCVDVVFYTKTGNSRSDIDNAYAAVADALQDCGQIANDRQIIKGSFDLRKGKSDYIEVIIRPLAG